MATDTSHKQRPIGTGFTPASTAEEVIAGIDLTGKNVVVTGGRSGLDREPTRVPSKADASVSVAVRGHRAGRCRRGRDRRSRDRSVRPG